MAGDQSPYPVPDEEFEFSGKCHVSGLILVFVKSNECMMMPSEASAIKQHASHKNKGRIYSEVEEKRANHEIGIKCRQKGAVKNQS